MFHRLQGELTTRAHAEDDAVEGEHQAKRSKGDETKRARIQKITEEYAAQINVVQMADDSFHTMDNYETDLDVEQTNDAMDLWADEDTLVFKNVAEDLWSDFNMDRQPPEPPEWVDMFANEVEIGRLMDMGVLIKEELYPSKVTRLTHHEVCP